LAGAAARLRQATRSPLQAPARVPLPDQPDPAFRCTLTGHTGWVNTLAAAPDGSWLASAGNDGTVRVWDIATPTPRKLC
jgi:WD40 repeat protein